MYAIIACSGCKRRRIIDVNTRSSVCPYCTARDAHKDLHFYFKSEDLSLTRAALNQITGFTQEPEKKRSSPDTDPVSTLEYRYEHCRSLEEKMGVLSEGLTAIYGEFTFEDLERFEPKNAEKMLKAMLFEGYVHETKYGRYRA